MTDRFAEYRLLARTLGVDAVALVPGPNFTRVMGHEFHSNERPLVIVIPADGPPAAVVPELELGSWGPLGFDGPTHAWRDQTGYTDAFAALARDVPIDTLAVEGQVMRVFVHHALKDAYGAIDIRDCETEISALRITKSASDIAAIERAVAISESALEEVLATVAAGQTEREIETRLLGALFANGAEGLAFPPIVAAADNSANSHAHARPDYRIRPGDALLLDFGARWRGFCADMTRTVFVGEPSPEARDVYETVLAANQAGHAATRPGATAHQIDDAVISVLEASAYADRIVTKTGHGIGRDVHEAPYIMRGNQTILEPGCVFTNEPGLYAQGKFGVRIEDVVLVTDTGSRSLTGFPKELRVI